MTSILLLVACGGLPPAELGACDYQGPTEYGDVIGPGATDEPAIACDGWWSCEAGSYYAGRVYPTSSHAGPDGRIPEDAVQAAQALLCDRCGWQAKPPIVEDPNALDLWGSCSWWM